MVALPVAAPPHPAARTAAAGVTRAVAVLLVMPRPVYRIELVYAVALRISGGCVPARRLLDAP